MKTGASPYGIVFRDESFLVFYEKWNKERDLLLGYKYHYTHPDGNYFHYDMEETARSGHPKYHLQHSKLGDNVRLPTGKVTGYE